MKAMKIRWLFVLLVLILGVHFLFAGTTGKIAGKVVDSETGEVLAGANVIITQIWSKNEPIELDNPMGAATNLDGQYFIINIPPASYSVKVSYMGYRPEVRERVLVRVDKTTRLNFELMPQALEGEAVTVTAYSEDVVQPDLTATRKTYDVPDIQDDVGISDITDILDLQSEVVGEHFRGGRAGEARYLLAGAAIVNPLTNERAFNPDVSGLQQVEVYTSGFSAEYGNAQSGVVNMVTKEGKSRWTSRVEFSFTVPYYKVWEQRFNEDGSAYYQGGSPYSPENLDYYNMLIDTTEWLKENPTQPGKPLFDEGFGFGPRYLPVSEWLSRWPPPSDAEKRRDSLKIASLSRVQWLMAHREVGMEYDDDVDYELTLSTGGPISKNMRLFFAMSQDIEQEIIPTPYPQQNRQLMSNLTYNMGLNNKFKFNFIYDREFDQSGYWRRILFDRELSMSKEINTSFQYGVEWNHIFNNSTFMDVKMNLLDLDSEERIELMAEDEFVVDYAKSSNWVDYNGPPYLRVGRAEDDKGDVKTRTYNLQGSLTSQVNQSNLLKTGIQFSFYDLDVDRKENTYSYGNYRDVEFAKQPYEGALYIQDKMEFEGLIANVGLRLDFYNFNTEYFADQFSPLRNPEFTAEENVAYYNRERAAKERAEVSYKLEPRIGISFPISEQTVFHLNYGTFMQRPAFNQILFNQITINNDIEAIGNPRLEPEITNSYDIGIVNSFPWGFNLDLSAYYKDVRNLIETAYYIDEQQTEYRTFVNRDYADIKGFHVDLERRRGSLRGYIRYNWEAATGKSSNAFNAPVTFFETPDPKYGYTELPDPEDVYLDFDRTHKIVIQLKYRTPSSGWFSIFGFRPLSNLSLSGTYRIMSGRPYTWDETGKGLRYNQRTPWEKNLRMRLQKQLEYKNTNFLLYVEGYNLLNEIRWHYSRTFTSGQEAYTRWHTDRREVLTYKEYAPYITSQELYLLNNEPRHFRIGCVIEY
ncbi:TonB-dependent receptor [candidate division KSB1 bacterium]|nr:TonB-dependent receptor [candidate division KSB1 bacterium]